MNFGSLTTALNESQREAIACSYAATLSHLIQGPPGTGKTLVLAHLAQMFVEDGQRVLITGFTHRAINNALAKTYALDPLLPICKVGPKKYAREVEFDTAESFADTGFARLPKGYIIGATPFATRSNRLRGVEFDVVIFDEASQVTLPLAIMGMLAGKKYVFIGDDKQLPPVVVSKGNQVGRHSVFSYLSERGNDTLLTTTYRLAQPLAEWPSDTFYSSLLVPHESVRDQKLPAMATADPDLAFILDPQRHKVFVNVNQQNTTTHSRLEADTVCRLVIELLANGIPPSEIGIIAPYRAQGREIRRRLMAEFPPEISQHIVADTVERMQGQERDVILVSLTTSSRQFAENLADFFFQPERLNVTITRARKKVILVGSLAVLAATPNTPEQVESVHLMRDYVQSCAQITYGV